MLSPECVELVCSRTHRLLLQVAEQEELYKLYMLLLKFLDFSKYKFYKLWKYLNIHLNTCDFAPGVIGLSGLFKSQI